MALIHSIMLPLGTAAPDFSLSDPATDEMVSLADFEDKKALLVTFICNHCPFVKHVADSFAALASEYQAKGVGVVAVMSNDVANFPDDGPDKMAQEKASRSYSFPYLYDETQEVAKSFRATCTPDYFIFDADQKLVYRGQMDGSRPDNGIPVSGQDLRAALDALIDGRPAPVAQTPSIGCNIKWKPDNEPDYLTAT